MNAWQRFLALLLLAKSNKWIAALLIVLLIVALIVWFSLAPSTRHAFLASVIGGLVGGWIVARSAR